MPPPILPAEQSAPLPNPSATLEQVDQEARALRESRSTNRIIVFSILFGVTGALGLPLLWFSKHFTGPEKLVWSLLVVLYTASLVAGTLGICWWALNQILPGGVNSLFPNRL